MQSKLRRNKETIKDLDKAISLKPDFAEAYANRGIAKNALGKYREAIKDYDIAISLKHDFDQVFLNRWITLADVYYKSRLCKICN